MSHYCLLGWLRSPGTAGRALQAADTVFLSVRLQAYSYLPSSQPAGLIWIPPCFPLKYDHGEDALLLLGENIGRTAEKIERMRLVGCEGYLGTRHLTALKGGQSR